MPPKEGIAIGTITSEPRPVEVRTGSNANIVVAVVIRQARMRRWPARTVASRISFFVSLLCSLKDCSKYVPITTPSSDAIPNKARKPTQTATLKFIG